MFPTLQLLLLFLLGVSVALGQNETESDPTDTDDEKKVYADERCLPGCFFKSNILQSSTLNLFPKKCSTVCAPYGLHIGIETDLSATQMASTLKNVKNLVGYLTIMRTKFKNCSFFENLESIDCYSTGYLWMVLNNNMTEVGMTRLRKVSCMIHIASNDNLTRLNMPNMMPVYSLYANFTQLEIEFYGNSDEFCVTIEEMENFMEYNTIIDRLGRTTGKYCEISNTSTFPQKTCDVGKIGLKNLDSDCVHLRGDLLIGEGDDDYVKKLSMVEIVFGRIQISGTNLTNINFLGKLQQVMSISKDQPTILVENNAALTNVSLPSIKRILATVTTPVQFKDNSPDLLKDSMQCLGILNKLNKEAPWLVKFDGKVCGDIKVAASPTPASPGKDNSSNNVFSDVLLVIGVLVARVMEN